jgi:hypothetical protein
MVPDAARKDENRALANTWFTHYARHSTERRSGPTVVRMRPYSARRRSPPPATFPVMGYQQRRRSAFTLDRDTLVTLGWNPLHRDPLD